MRVLDDAVDVLLCATWDSSTLTHAHINNETALVLLREELGDGELLAEHTTWHWGHPDGPVDVLLGEEVDILEVVDIDGADKVDSLETLVKVNLVVLAQEVVLDPEVLELGGATFLGEDHLLEEVRDAFIVDEVPLDGELGDLGGRVSQDSLNDALEASESDPVVTNIEEAEAGVRLQGSSESTGTIDVKNVAVKGEGLKRAVSLEGFTDADHARDAEIATAQVEG